MKIVQILLFSLDIINKPPVDCHEINVPEDSVFLKVMILNEGVYLWYQVPEIHTMLRKERFKVIITGKDVPRNYTFIDIVSTELETEKGDKVLIMFPIFKETTVVVPFI